MYFSQVKPSRPTGPRACSLSVEMPISAPNPYSKPSAKHVGVLIITDDESTSATKRRVSIEYALIKDMNDHAWRADLLGQKLNERGKGWVHVNPIPLNPTPGSIWTASTSEVTREFIYRLEKAGIPTTLRDTRGKEIDGACGQLAATED